METYRINTCDFSWGGGGGGGGADSVSPGGSETRPLCKQQLDGIVRTKQAKFLHYLIKISDNLRKI